MKNKVLRSGTRSPVALARKSMAVAQAALPAFSSKYSKHDYTQAQLFTCLVLKEFFHTGYRDVIALLKDFSELRQAMGMDKGKLPDHSTLVKARQRLGKAIASTF